MRCVVDRRVHRSFFFLLETKLSTHRISVTHKNLCPKKDMPTNSSPTTKHRASECGMKCSNDTTPQRDRTSARALTRDTGDYRKCTRRRRTTCRPHVNGIRLFHWYTGRPEILYLSHVF